MAETVSEDRFQQGLAVRQVILANSKPRYFRQTLCDSIPLANRCKQRFSVLWMTALPQTLQSFFTNTAASITVLYHSCRSTWPHGCLLRLHYRRTTKLNLKVTHPRASVLQSDWSRQISGAGSQRFEPPNVTRLFPPTCGKRK